MDIEHIVRSNPIQLAAKKVLVSNISACDEVWAVSHGAGENLRSLGYEGDYIVMTYNVMVYIAAGMLSGNWILPLYSIVAYYVGLNAVDFIVEGIDRSKGVMIITDKADEVCAALMDAFACGTTKIAAKGGFSDADKTMVYFVVNRFQIARMRNIVHSIDPCAFMTINEVADVFKSNSSELDNNDTQKEE